MWIYGFMRFAQRYADANEWVASEQRRECGELKKAQLLFFNTTGTGGVADIRLFALEPA